MGVEEKDLHKSADFIRQYKEFVDSFDAVSLYQDEKQEMMVKEFIAKHDNYVKKIPFSVDTKFPDGGYYEILDEDRHLLYNDERNVFNGNHASEHGTILANLYSRASVAVYIRSTYRLWRFKQDSDRRQAVEFAQRAIRYDPNCGYATYRYMIAIGWQLEPISNDRPKEKIWLSELFHLSILRTIHLLPNDPLAYHLLGRFYYVIAGLNWFERTAIRSTIGHKFEGSYEDAERELMRSFRLHSDWLPGALWIARVALARKKPLKEVKYWLDAGLKMRCSEPVNEIEREELLEMRQKLKLDSDGQ